MDSGSEPYRHVPYDIDVEQALLGAILRDNRAVERVSAHIKPDHFYDPLHGRIFETMSQMIEVGGVTVTPLTLHATMKSDPGVIETGGQAYFDALRAAAPAIPNVKDYADILADLAVRRSLIRIGEDIVNTAYDAPTDKPTTELIRVAEQGLRAAREQTPSCLGIRATPFIWVPAPSIPTREWLYGRHYIRKFVSATIAQGGVGKSTLGIAEELAMVTSRPLLGHCPARALRVWSWNLEDPTDELDRRYAAACLHYGIRETEIGGRLFRDSGRDQPCVIARTDRQGAFIVEPVADAIIAELRAKKIDVLRIDPFVSCHNVTENDNTAIDMVAKKWGQVADQANCAIDLTHHSRKIGAQEATAEDSRGASALINGCRSVRVLNRMTKEEGAKANIHNPRTFFRTSTDKSNLAPPSDKSDWYKLENIDLGNGPPADRVGVVVPWKWPDAFDDLPPGTLFKVQKAIAEGEWRESPQAQQWAGKAVAQVLALDISDLSVRAKCKTLLHSWIEGGALKVVERDDHTRQKRDFIEVGQWEPV